MEQTDNVNSVRNRLPNLRIRKTAIKLPTMERNIENDIVHSTLIGAPNVLNIATKYGNNGNPDNKFM